VSPSRAALIADEPFWGYAVISTEELGRLLDALASPPGWPLAAGPYRPDGPGYYAEVDADGRLHHCALGSVETTGAVLRRVAAALEPDHRPPVTDILARLGQS
jgi:hypothetical protein